MAGKYRYAVFLNITFPQPSRGGECVYESFVPVEDFAGRIPPPRPTSHRDGRLRQPPHHTGHGPLRTRPPNLS